MKLSRIFVTTLLAGALTVLGCGDSGSGSNGGGNGTDPGSICADCAPGQQLEDCQNDLLICDTLSDPGLLEACINDARC